MAYNSENYTVVRFSYVIQSTSSAVCQIPGGSKQAYLPNRPLIAHVHGPNTEVKTPPFCPCEAQPLKFKLNSLGLKYFAVIALVGAKLSNCF
ncbi:hypothetical protein QQF64_029195 [Cirrhinus molitorella]|uniref:Uncharacterized protein n=1 Tax=Cirrhinus molitorella TaxID=172907 RepID=A0ABR3N8Q1_9TELE